MNRFLLLLVTLLGVASFFFFLNMQNNNTELDIPASCVFEPDMVLIPQGKVTLGAGAIYDEEKPSTTQHVESFYISKYEVTNGEFEAFVKATNYKTLAEQGAQPGSAVFRELKDALLAKNILNWWQFVPNVNWQKPFGEDSNIRDKANYPVVHIAYEDALAYANWKGHRLLTEAEFEYVSRNKLEGKKYEYGDQLAPNGVHKANTWQGLFPFNDDAEDGFAGLAPVGCYPPNKFGVHDMIGNVWEWTSDIYYPRFIMQSELAKSLPKQGYDPNQPGVSVGVIKGGSYLCAPNFCMRYRPSARLAQDTQLGTSHIGFRTAKSIGSP